MKDLKNAFETNTSQLHTKILETISTSKQGLKSLGLVPQNSVLAESLGILLSSLMWLLIIAVYLIVICILSLLSLIELILTRLGRLLKNIKPQVSNVLSILCRWVVEVKNTILTSKKSQTSVWKEDGDLLQGYTSAYSEMPGGPKIDMPKKHYKKENKIIDVDAIRKSGY